MLWVWLADAVWWITGEVVDAWQGEPLTFPGGIDLAVPVPGGFDLDAMETVFVFMLGMAAVLILGRLIVFLYRLVPLNG